MAAKYSCSKCGGFVLPPFPQKCPHCGDYFKPQSIEDARLNQRMETSAAIAFLGGFLNTVILLKTMNLFVGNILGALEVNSFPLVMLSLLIASMGIFYRSAYDFLQKKRKNCIQAIIVLVGLWFGCIVGGMVIALLADRFQIVNGGISFLIITILSLVVSLIGIRIFQFRFDLIKSDLQ